MTKIFIFCSWELSLDVSASLDDNGKRLVDRLARITQELDYSNGAQDEALQQLRALGFIH